MLKLKVMIVEDESLERMLLRRYLEMEPGLYEVVKEAAFALEALEYLDEHKVDIVITDINMPVMDGLEMASRILKLDASIQVIVITGYNDFDHAQRAIKIGVVDYIVKPVDAKEFSLVLSNVREKIFSRQGGDIEQTEIEQQIAQSIPALRDRFLYDLMIKRMKPELITDKVSFFKMDMSKACYQVAVIMLIPNDLDGKQKLFALYSAGNIAREMFEVCYAFIGDENQMVLISNQTEEQPDDFEMLKHVLDGTLSVPVTVGVGTIIKDLHDIHRSYVQAVRAAQCHTFLGAQQVIFYQELGMVEDDSSQDEALQLDAAELEEMGFFLRYGVSTSVREWIEQHFSDNLTGIDDIRLRAVQVASSLHTKRLESFSSVKDRIAQLLDLKTVSEIRELLLQFMGEASSTMEGIRTSTVSRQIQSIVDYVQEHLSDSSLSLHETARLFYFNASYLSRAFKQYTGMSFREYVNKLRIESARKYLDDPCVKAYEVGVRVGIEDPNYFSTLFKKYTGMTIKQYRAGQEHG